MSRFVGGRSGTLFRRPIRQDAPRLRIRPDRDLGWALGLPGHKYLDRRTAEGKRGHKPAHFIPNDQTSEFDVAVGGFCREEADVADSKFGCRPEIGKFTPDPIWDLFERGADIYVVSRHVILRTYNIRAEFPLRSAIVRSERN